MDKQAQSAKIKASIYAIGAVNGETAKTHLGIQDVTLLSRNEKQLLYEYVYPNPKPDKNRMWQVTTHENVVGIVIDSEKKFFHFVQDYLNDQKQLEAGIIPENLTHDFYVFKYKIAAEKALAELKAKQESDYKNLHPFMQPYTPKQKLVIMDLIVELAKYVPEAISKMLDDPQARENFEHNASKFKQRVQNKDQ